MPDLHPLALLLIGLVTVVGLIIRWRVHAFLALIAAALVVSLLSPGEWVDKIARVATAFGQTTAGIGIVIALAAIIGLCMLESGAADRIVRWLLDRLGEKRSATALMTGGFILAVPVFFDTVFYLLVPLARSMFRRTGRNYLKYLMAIAAGAAITHTLVPPTPGPLVMAANLNIDLGVMTLAGLAVAVPSVVVGMGYAVWLNRRLEVPMRAIDDHVESEPMPADALPTLGHSLLPIILPVVLIAGNTLAQTTASGSGIASLFAVIGNANFAMFTAAAVAIGLYIRHRRLESDPVPRLVERALMSGGVIILITAAGGAFGAMLKTAGIGDALGAYFGGEQAGGFVVLFLGFGVSALFKISQGSSTVAMITASAMLASMIESTGLPFNPAYLATAIGSGALVGSWMNDSGFWIFTKMGGLTEVEALKSWTPLLVVLGFAGLATSTLLAWLLPFGG